MRVALFVLATLALVLALLPPDDLPPPFVYADKVKHFGIFAMLGGLARLGYREAHKWIIVERLAFFGAAIEVLQSIPFIGRDSDALDWVADIAGAGAGVAIATAFATFVLARRG